MVTLIAVLLFGCFAEPPTTVSASTSSSGSAATMTADASSSATGDASSVMTADASSSTTGDASSAMTADTSTSTGTGTGTSTSACMGDTGLAVDPSAYQISDGCTACPAACIFDGEGTATCAPYCEPGGGVGSCPSPGWGCPTCLSDVVVGASEVCFLDCSQTDACEDGMVCADLPEPWNFGAPLRGCLWEDASGTSTG